MTSGPAKGYIDALEHRLHETEDILLRLLAQISDDQLSTALADHFESQESSDVDGFSSEPYLRLGRRGVNYWKSFPLNSPENIRNWERDFLGQRGLSPIDRRTSQVAWQTPEVELASPPQAARRLSHSLEAIGYARRISSAEESLHHDQSSKLQGHALHSPSETAAMVTQANQQDHHARYDGSNVSWSDTTHPAAANIPSHMLLDTLNQPHFSSSDVFRLNANQEPSSWRGAPPPRFQQQFLW